MLNSVKLNFDRFHKGEKTPDRNGIKLRQKCGNFGIIFKHGPAAALLIIYCYVTCSLTLPPWAGRPAGGRRRRSRRARTPPGLTKSEGEKFNYGGETSLLFVTLIYPTLLSMIRSPVRLRLIWFPTGARPLLYCRIFLPPSSPPPPSLPPSFSATASLA